MTTQDHGQDHGQDHEQDHGQDHEPDRLDLSGAEPVVAGGPDDPAADDPDPGADVVTAEEVRPAGAAGRRRKERSRLPGCLAVLVALAVVVGGALFLVSQGKAWIDDRFGAPEDYPGPGAGRVMFEVEEGDSVARIGSNLAEAGVVASAEAFTEAARGNPDATGIQVGFYRLKREMAAADALEVLVDPANLVSTAVTVPEGLRVVDIVEILAEQTDYSARQFEKVLDSPERLGLPDYAGGNPEGYLFPATYGFGPKDRPVDMLRAMVARWEQAAKDADLEGAAERLGYTPAELMTIASLVEAEGRGDDMPKIARVIYNRLENPDNGETNGLLQIDASVNYGLGQQLGVALTTEQLEQDTPYNTYLHPGLPPTPIEASGDAAIAAAAQPADGDWLYYVTVNLATGETKFTDDYQEFLRFKAEFQEYCQTSDAC